MEVKQGAQSAESLQASEESPLLLQEDPQASLNRLSVSAAAGTVEKERGEAVREKRGEIVRRNTELEKICHLRLGFPEVEGARAKQA